MVQVDQKQLGTIKIDLFTKLLALHNVTLSTETLDQVKLLSRANSSDFVNYKEALRLIMPNVSNTTAEEPLCKEWVLQSCTQS